MFGLGPGYITETSKLTGYSLCAFMISGDFLEMLMDLKFHDLTYFGNMSL